MKSALCLYGQPRNFSYNYNFIYKNVIEPNNCDVFFHTWYDENDTSLKKMTPGHESRHLESNLQNILPEILKPKKFILEKQKNFLKKDIFVSEENMELIWPWAKVYDRETFIQDTVHRHYSMWYSIQQSILLKELYAQENGFEYDCVFLSRFDVSPKIPININNYNLNKLITPNMNLPRNEINDWFLFTNNKNINMVSTTFNLIDFHRDNIIEKNGSWTNEAYLREQVRLFDIEIDHQDLNVTF
jgi:hypothetical protein